MSPSAERRTDRAAVQYPRGPDRDRQVEDGHRKFKFSNRGRPEAPVSGEFFIMRRKDFYWEKSSGYRSSALRFRRAFAAFVRVLHASTQVRA